MRKYREVTDKPVKRDRVPLDPEAREMQLISLATDLAEKQLREGTASSQVITHYLKLGTQREKIEKEILEKQKDLISAKTEALQSQRKSEEMYAKVIEAFKNCGSAIFADEEVSEDD